MDQTLKEDSDKKAYEVSFLLESEDKIDDVKRLFAQHGVDITEESPQKKINLAYEIKRMSQAFFGTLRVFSWPQNIKLLEKDLRGNKNVLRSLIVSLPSEKRDGGQDLKKPAMPVRRQSIFQRESRSKPLSNEAIEKKIEEILQ